MALALPKLSSGIAVDLTELKASLRDGINEARAFKGKFESSLAGMKVGPINFAAAAARSQAKSFSAGASSAAFRRDVKMEMSFDEKQIRKNVADAIKVARSEAASKRIALQVGGFDPVAEARQRFASTAGAAEKAAAGVSDRLGDWTNKAVKAGLILKAIEGTIGLVAAGIGLWGTRQADANGEVEKAAKGYLAVAAAVKDVPIVGGLAFKISDAISGGAGTAAEQALKDAAANDAKSKAMVQSHKDATAAMTLQTERARAEAMQGDDREFSLGRIARDEAIGQIKEQIRLKLVSAEVGQAAMAAERQKLIALFDEQQARGMKAAREKLDQQRKEAEEAKAAAQRPFDDLAKQMATFGMSEEDRMLFDFKADPTQTAETIARYEVVIGKLKEMKQLQKMDDDVKAWKESIKGPVEQYDEVIKRLKEWRDAGKITAEEFAKGVQGAKGELGKNAPGEQQQRPEARFASFIKAGGADALRLQFSLSRDANRDKIPQQQLDSAKRQEDLLTSINDRLDLKVI